MSFQNGSTFINSTRASYIIRELFNENKIYSPKTAGVVFTTPKEIAVMGSTLPADDFIRSKEFTDASRNYMNVLRKDGIVSVLGYCGDAHSENNKHPTVINGIVGVCDGVVYNEKDLSNKLGKNNGEKTGNSIIFELIDYFRNKHLMLMPEAMIHAASLVSGKYSCVFVEKSNPFLLWIIRSQGSLVARQYADCGLILFATRSCSVNNVIDSMYLGLNKDSCNFITIPENHSACINLFSNKISIYRNIEASKELACNGCSYI